MHISKFTWDIIICMPPSRNKILLPNLSTVKMETNVARTLIVPVITADMSEALSPKPRVLKRTGA